MGGGGGGAVIPRVAGKVPVKSAIISLHYFPSPPPLPSMIVDQKPSCGRGWGRDSHSSCGWQGSCKISNNFIKVILLFWFYISHIARIKYGYILLEIGVVTVVALMG